MCNYQWCQNERVNGGDWIVQINALKIFNAINAGAELVLVTPFTAAASVSFFLKSIAFI